MWQNGLMRLFIAIDPPREMRTCLNLLARGLAEDVPCVRPVTAENLHLTLHFLGDVADDDVSLVSDAVVRVAAEHSPCAAKVCSVGSFGRRAAPSILWAGVEGVDGLLRIQSSLGGELRKAQVACDDRSFIPHITIARVRAGRRVRRLAPLIDTYADMDFGILHIESIALVKSTLTPEGASYETLLKPSLGE